MAPSPKTSPRCSGSSDGGRLGLRFLVLELTRACNHRCAHCYDRARRALHPPPSTPVLSRAAIRELVARVRAETTLEHVALSGGEPFLREDLPGIAGDLADAGLGVVVITNGARLRSARLSRFPRGTVFEVTLFSADAALHDRMAGTPCFEEVLLGVSRLEKLRHHLAVSIVICRANAHDVGRTMRLALAAGAGTVLLNRVNLSSGSYARASALVPDAAALRLALRQADDVAGRYRTGVAVSVPVPPCLIEPREYPHLQFCWCPRGSDSSYYTVDPWGRLRPCNHSSRVLGDLRTSGFGALVRSCRASAFWSRSPPACAGCTHPLARQCGGGCRAAADECLGRTDEVDPFVAWCSGRR